MRRNVSFIMCGAARIIVVVVASGAVEIVLCVPGFAQSNTAYRAIAAIDRTSALALREYEVPSHSARSVAELPSNLLVPSVYRVLLETMLQRSMTFRRQCVRLASTPELTVTLQAGGAGGSSRVRARTRIVRRPGELMAAIHVIRLDEPVELIAHEIEHVIEQLDGVDLPSRAVIAESGVHGGAGDEDAFETTRATRVGLTVAAEFRRSGG